MSNTVFLKSFDPLPILVGEVMRYAGVKDASDSFLATLDSCINEAKDAFSYNVCYREYPVSVGDGFVHLGFSTVRSRMLTEKLSGCSSVVLFAATVGHGIDRLIARYSALSPARAFVLSALGSERIESLCDAFCETVKAEKAALGLTAIPRLSPGYSDFPLDVQRDIFATLNPEKSLGLTLGSTLFMSPSKSVSAIIGIK